MSAPRARIDDMPGAALIAAAGAAEDAAAARLAAAEAEIGRPRSRSLDEETRARAALIAETVVGEVSALLRAAEPVLDGGHAVTVPDRFAVVGLIARSGLGAAALARADEHRIAAALARVVDDGDDAVAEASDPDAGEETAAVRRAEAVRIDRSGDPLLPLHDLAAEDRHALFWHVAACLADATLATLGEARVGGEDGIHRAAGAAVARTLAAVDDAAGLAPATLRLAHRLEASGGIEDGRLATTLAAGRIALLAAMLAVRAGIGVEPARAMIDDPARCAVLLRACGVERDTAAAMIVALALARTDSDGDDPLRVVAPLIEAYDTLPPDRARAEVRRVRLEPAYRDALSALARS